MLAGMEAITLEATLANLPALLTRPEVAEFLRCRREFVSDLIRSGELAAIQRKARQGSRLLIPRESIRAYLARASR